MQVEYKPELFLPAWTRHDGTNQEEETLYVAQSMLTAQKAAVMLVLCLHEAPQGIEVGKCRSTKFNSVGSHSLR